MKNVLGILAALCLATALTAQAAPPIYTVENGVVKWKSADHGLDTVWPATLKVLMEMDWEIKSAEKNSLFISARKSMANSVVMIDADRWPGLNIAFDTTSGETVMMVKIVGIGWNKQTFEKFFDTFFEKLTDALK